MLYVLHLLLSTNTASHSIVSFRQSFDFIVDIRFSKVSASQRLVPI